MGLVMMAEEAQRIAAEPCTCVPCSVCGGTGTVWVAVGGKFLGNHRADDHTATWTDGMRVTRLARHGRQLWIEIAYAGATHEIRLGPRTFKASRVRSQK